MNKEKLYLNIFFFGLSLFIFTFLFYLNLPLKTTIILGIGYLCMICSMGGLLSIYRKKDDSITDEKIM